MDHSAELFVRLIGVVVMVVNALMMMAGAAIWRSFRSFKEDQKKSLRDFVELHIREHERIGDELTTLFDREREDRDILKATEKGLVDHIAHCKDTRDTCPGRHGR
jgi:hypothetical protein